MSRISEVSRSDKDDSVAESHKFREIRTAKGIEMLVLTRKRSEMIQIGDNIIVKVIRTGRSTVKIGVEAPADVRVLRAELCDVPRPTAATAVAAKPEMKPVVREELVANCSDQFPHPFVV
jgi:carbon storage regulator